MIIGSAFLVFLRHTSSRINPTTSIHRILYFFTLVDTRFMNVLARWWTNGIPWDTTSAYIRREAMNERGRRPYHFTIYLWNPGVQSNTHNTQHGPGSKEIHLTIPFWWYLYVHIWNRLSVFCTISPPVTDGVKCYVCMYLTIQVLHHIYLIVHMFRKASTSVRISHFCIYQNFLKHLPDVPC